MKRLVIYTCITGGYDRIADPGYTVPWADYIVFSPEKLESGIWQWRPLQHIDKDNTRTSRWHKLNPHLLFPDSDYSLWIDGNIIIKDSAFYESVEKLMDSGEKYAAILHPKGGNIVDEAKRILHNDKESMCRLARVLRHLRSENFPKNSAIYETNILLRAHNDTEVKKSDELWWASLSEYTSRDQMTHSYSLWKCGIKPTLLLPEGTDVRKSPSFEYVLHGKIWKKDKSLKGRYLDARRAVKETVFRCLFPSR